MKPVKKFIHNKAVHSMKAGLRKFGLHTVCEEARCPNLSECFNRGAATFMILGDTCTRSCRFCAVKHATDIHTPMVGLNNPMGVNAGEPQNIARMVSDLKLKHVVLTSVTRDDLKDEGAGQFAATINCIKSLMVSSVTIEVLTPDFHAREDCLKTVCKAGPNIFNHNIETVRRLTPIIRSNADYDRSMDVLRWVSKNGLGIVVKSGLMTGLGETREEIMETLKDLKNAGCQIVTIGQYLQPRKENIGVQRYLSDEEFKELKEKGEDLGIKKVFSGPFVRSSYMAETQILNSKH